MIENELNIKLLQHELLKITDLENKCALLSSEIERLKNLLEARTISLDQ